MAILDEILIAKMRRKINDSKLGQKINHTTLGCVVEAASRKVMDAVDKVREPIQGFIEDNCFKADSYNKAALWMYTTSLSGVLFSPAEYEQPARHYSHTSKLYQKVGEETRFSDGRMERVPLKEALKK